MRVDTQEQKADCYRIFANMVAESPFMVGYHYFMWADEPAMGISSAFPEDSNYGLVNEKDEPYALFIKTAAEVNAQVAQRHEHSGFSGLMVLAAGPNRVEVQNTNAVEAHGHLRLTVQGRSRVEEVWLKPGERRQVQMPPDTVWCAELQNWDGGKQRVLGGKLRPEAFTLLKRTGSARVLSSGAVHYRQQAGRLLRFAGSGARLAGDFLDESARRYSSGQPVCREPGDAFRETVAGRTGAFPLGVWVEPDQGVEGVFEIEPAIEECRDPGGYCRD